MRARVPRRLGIGRSLRCETSARREASRIGPVGGDDDYDDPEGAAIRRERAVVCRGLAYATDN